MLQAQSYIGPGGQITEAILYTGRSAVLKIPMGIQKCDKCPTAELGSASACRCVQTYFEVPFGYWYRLKPKPEIIRRWSQKEINEWLDSQSDAC